MAKYFENDSRSMRDRMQAGDLYIADDPQLEADSLRAASLSDQYNRLSPQDPDAAAPLLAELLGGIGEQSVIRAPLFVDYGKYLTVGARTFINFNLTALDVAAITIGDDVQIGPNVQLLTPTHPLEAEARRDKLEAAKPITIGNNVWLGGGVIVLPGVNIGENTVVGAGSVVTRDLPANVVAVGNPARVIRELPES
ncbi:sugar O-acetyltransferase [Arthrobacter koreensis]|uniref:Acetyltransferase n=2 Tax=Arthrobacter koreensis TaxID=199136 RepID=A0ABY6FT12_9MICC|nr:sugar O-acetyltransferase [Arthrobacter koreensis]MEB7447046.1 sugar O-acetyltransferase [Arthrobacter koreensis]UYB36172.1 sugar O-acetyltransferase [Arthrobacter koreensis]